MLNKLNKSQFKYLLIFWLIILGIIRIIFNPAELFSGKILAVFMIYSIGAYIRKFVDIKPKQKYSIKYIMLTIIFTLLYIILITIHGVITNETLYNLFYKIIVNFREFYNLIVVAMTIIIFMKFKTMKIKSKLLSKVILFISPSVFSIYLIHYNYNIRDDIWLNSGAMNFANSWLMIPYIILTIIAVFIICLTIDLIRRGIYALLKKIPLLNKGIDKLNSFINRLNLKINNSISIETNQT